MKVLPWILVCLLLGILVWMRCNSHDPSLAYVQGDTVHIRDTVRDTILKSVREILKRTDTVYREKEIITLKPKHKRWGLALQAGYGYPGGLYVGGGVSYNLFMW